jgi:2-polyprenyl-3-methyl-5-hydroxy-6-metoxy-1,4-benzoquinol methylase
MPLAHTRVFRCGRRDCDLQFAAPQLNDHELAQAYASLYYRADGSQPVLENTPEVDVRYLVGRLSEQFGSPAGKRVLDYGCGVGTLLRVANEVGAHATGIEQSDTAREKIEGAGFATVYADLDALGRAEPQAQFDWIVLCEVIEHLRRPWEDLEKLRPLLKPTGDLIILTPNFDALRSRLSRDRWDQRVNLTHLYYFTPHSLSAVLRRAGFEPSEMPPVSWYSNHGLVRRQVQRLLCAAGLQGSLMFSGKVVEAMAPAVAV